MNTASRLNRGLRAASFVAAGLLAFSIGPAAGAMGPPGGVVAAAVPSSITLSSAANPSVTGQPASFTASVVCGATPASGLVTFLDGASPLGTASLDPTSTATFSTAGLEPGSHSITASFATTPECDASTSPPELQQVDKGASYVLLDVSSFVAVLGRPLVVTAEVGAMSPAAGTPTGTVTFSVSGTNLPPVGLDGAGHASITVPDPGVFSGGTPCNDCFHLSATYSGDARFEPSAFDEGPGGVISVPAVGTMQTSVLSGAPGSSISVSSVTGCPPPSTDPNSGWHVDVTLVQGATVIGSASFVVNRYGAGLMWDGQLIVDPGATPGEATLRASCVATPEGAGATYAYEPLTFTVTGASTEQPTTVAAAELPRTGRSSSELAASGVLVLLVGLALTRANRQRRHVESQLPGSPHFGVRRVVPPAHGHRDRVSREA